MTLDHAFSSRTYEPVREAEAEFDVHAILDSEPGVLDPEGMRIQCHHDVPPRV